MIAAFLSAVFVGVAVCLICLCVVGGALAAVARLTPDRNDDLMVVADAVQDRPVPDVYWTRVDEAQFRRYLREQ